MAKKNSSVVKKQHAIYSLVSFLLFTLGFSLLYQGVLNRSFSSLLIMCALFLVGTMFVTKIKKSLPIPELSGILLLYIVLFIDWSFIFSNTVSGLFHPFLFVLLGVVYVKLYDIRLEYKTSSVKKFFIILGVSILFAYLFLLLNEPFPSFIKGSFFLLLLFTFIVSLGEELVFRGASFSLTKKVFSKETAVHVQAAIFTVIHLLSFMTLYYFYATNGGSLILKDPGVNVFIYAVALYGFAIIAARYAKGEKDTNILYPVYFHWLVNFLNLVILII